MKFPFFASFIVFCLWLTYEIHKSRRKEEQSAEAFWAREAEANRTRRRPLDDLSYITIPFDTLPMDTMKDDPEIADCHDTLHSLSEGPIVNLTGISNTDLKLMYGAPNISHSTISAIPSLPEPCKGLQCFYTREAVSKMPKRSLPLPFPPEPMSVLPTVFLPAFIRSSAPLKRSMT